MAEGDDQKKKSQTGIDVDVQCDEDDAEPAEDNCEVGKAHDGGAKPKEAATTVAVAEEQPFLRNLKILPPLQKAGCESFNDRRCVSLPPIRAEEPVASLRAALGEVVGYAHLTHYRFVLENESSAFSSSAGDSKAVGGSGRQTKGAQQGGSGKKGKKKKKSAFPTSSGEGKAKPMHDVITPYTGRNAVVCAPAAVRSLESDPSRKVKTAAAPRIETEPGELTPANDEDGALVLDDYGDLNPLLEKGLGDGSAFRIVLERYDVAGVRDHVARLKGLFAGGNVPAATTLADEEAAGKGSEQLVKAGDNEKDSSIAESAAVASAVAAAPKGKDDGQASETDNDASIGEEAIDATKESGGANSFDEKQNKDDKVVKAKKPVELMPEFNLDQKVSANGSDLSHFYYLSCGEEDAVRAIQTSSEGCGDGSADNQPTASADATIEELAAAVESSSASPKQQHKKKNGKHHKNGKHKGKSSEDAKGETTTAEKKIAEAKENIAFNRRLNELESGTVVHCTVRYSGFHPPPRSRRIMGDLAYLEVETPAFPDEPAVHVTAGPTGFYVNRTKGGRGSASTGYVFDPSPALDRCFSHDLLDCLLQKSASLRSAWAHALSMSKERARLAAKLSASDGPLEALHRVAVRSDAGGTTTHVPATQGIDSIVLRPSWLVPFPLESGQTSSSVRKQSNKWNHNAMHGFDTNRTEEDLSSTFGLDIRGGALRDWNEELQSAREMPTETLQDRIERARMIHKVLSDFGEASLAGAQSIFDGHISPMNPNEPTRSHVYLHNNIFFSRAVDAGVDTFKIAQGDGAARKSASRDAQCIGAIHRLDVKGLHTLATVLVDYLGTRLVCQSIVPGILHGEKTHTLLYGAVEATSPLSWDKEMHTLLEETLGKGLMVASRPVPTLPLSDERMEEIERLKTVVLPLDNREKAEDKGKKDGTKKTTTVCGPVEAKGIRGSDQRKYILDLTRVTPRDANWVPKAFGGTGHWGDDLDVSGGGKANLLSSKLEEYVPKSLEDDEWTTAVLRPELVTNFTHKKMSEWLEAKMSTETVGKGKVDTKPDDIREKEEENGKSGAESTKTPVSAPDTNDDLKSCVSIRRQSIGPEDEQHLQTLRLNLNVFLPHVKSLEDVDEESFEQTKKDEIVVRELASYLWSTLLPKLTQEMRDNSGHQIPVDGSSLTELLHQRGINCRYMGRLATLAAQEESKDRKAEADVRSGVATTLPRRVMPLCWLEMLECEMVARAAKHVLDGYFTENAGAAGNQPSQTVASFLSALMSTGEESAAETEVRGQEDDKGERMAAPDEDDMNGLTMFDTGGGGDAIPPPIRGRAEVWEDIEREIGSRFRYVLTLYNRPAATHTASKGKSDQKWSSRALYVPLLRRVCQRNGIRLVARDYAVGGKCLCSGGNSSGGRMTASHPVSPVDIVDILPLVKHSAAHGGEGFVATTFNGASVGSPSLHVLLPDAKATLEAAHVNWNARTLPAALDLAQEAASLYQRVVDTPLHSSVGRCLDLIAVILFQANEPELAAANAARALAVSVQLGGFDSAEAVTAHSTLSHVLISSGKLAVGVKHLRAALYLMELMAGPRYAELANVYHKLGTMYHEMGSGINALRFYQEAATRKSCDRMVEGMVAKSTALVLAALGQFKAALESEKRAYSIYRCILGEDHDLTKNSGNTLKQFMKVAVEQGTRIAAEDKKRKEQQAADAIATKIEADETEEEKKKAKKKKAKKKKSKS